MIFDCRNMKCLEHHGDWASAVRCMRSNMTSPAAAVHRRPSFPLPAEPDAQRWFQDALTSEVGAYEADCLERDTLISSTGSTFDDSAEADFRAKTDVGAKETALPARSMAVQTTDSPSVVSLFCQYLRGRQTVEDEMVTAKTQQFYASEAVTQVGR